MNEARIRGIRASWVSTSAPSPLGAECGTGLGGVGDRVDAPVPGLAAGTPNVTAMKRKRRCTDMATRGNAYGYAVTGRPEKVIPRICQAMTDDSGVVLPTGPPTRSL